MVLCRECLGLLNDQLLHVGWQGGFCCNYFFCFLPFLYILKTFIVLFIVALNEHEINIT